MPFIFLLIAGALFVIAYKTKKDIFHPALLYSILYSLLFAIISLHLSRFQTEWSFSSTALFVMASIGFIGSGGIVSVLMRARGFHSHPRPADVLAARESGIDWHWFYAVTLCFFLFFLVTYLYGFARTHQIPLFSPSLGKLRFVYLAGNFLVAFGGAAGPIVIMLCSELLISHTASRSLKVKAGVMLAVSFLLYFTLITRMPLVRCLIYAMVLFQWFRGRITFGKSALILCGTILFFAVGFLFRAHTLSFKDITVAESVHIKKNFLLIANPYSYAANNFWNYDFGISKYVDDFQGYRFGKGFELFRGILFFLRVEDPLEKGYGFDSIFNDSVVKVEGLNSVLYVWHFYKDFGFWGVFFIPLLFGFTVHFFHYNTSIAPSHLRVCVLGIIAGMIMFSFMIPLWSFWNPYYEFGVLLLAHKSLRLA